MYAQHFVFSLGGLEEFVCQGRLLVEAVSVGRVREQALCPRHPAGRGCAHHHLAQGVGSQAGCQTIEYRVQKYTAGQLASCH